VADCWYLYPSSRPANWKPRLNQPRSNQINHQKINEQKKMIVTMLNDEQSNEEMINVTNHVTDSPTEKTGNNPIRHNDNVCSSSLLAIRYNDNVYSSSLLVTLLASSLTNDLIDDHICYTLISQIDYDIPMIEASVIPNGLLN